MEQTKLRVLFLANVPSPYRVEFFNVLGRECDLTVLYQLHSSAERDKKWTAQADPCYARIYLKGRATGVDKALCPGVISWLQKGWDAIVISGNTSPTELLAIAWCKLRGIPYCLEADGAFPGSGSGIREFVKTQAIRGANMYLSTCRELDKYYLRYGADLQRIRRYRFSSLTEADILPQRPSREAKTAIRGELGIREEKVLLSIGQFIPRKGIDLLLQAANGMDKRIGIYIVGGTPTEEYLTFARENDLTSVHFVPFQEKESLKRYYIAADAFVLPTREDIWGLVVNEAMAFGHRPVQRGTGADPERKKRLPGAYGGRPRPAGGHCGMPGGQPGSGAGRSGDHTALYGPEYGRRPHHLSDGICPWKLRSRLHEERKNTGSAGSPPQSRQSRVCRPEPPPLPQPLGQRAPMRSVPAPGLQSGELWGQQPGHHRRPGPADGLRLPL